ncbi:recombination regulator RecX [Methylibium rhizosphaerae]|uniref:recombination regulator RecX n=1 Tax=Methylibium rhizosphaerae TaxID=2570323 RepID=UPI001129844C|nr:recombination regulator RecX [Methylibium rhizosphaerae]
MPAPKLSLKGRALKYLAAREHSRAELLRKLAPHAEEPAEVERVLDELEARGLLSAERFVESLLHRRAARLGTARLRQELQQHKLPADAVAQAVEALRGTELERARAVWQRRFGGEPAADAAERARQVRFLTARGFSSEVIRRVVRGADGD